MTITCPENDSSGTCQVISGAGAGLGIFIQYLGQSLPSLLIVLAIVGVFVAVGIGIAKLLENGIQKVTNK